MNAKMKGPVFKQGPSVLSGIGEELNGKNSYESIIDRKASNIQRLGKNFSTFPEPFSSIFTLFPGKRQEKTGFFAPAVELKKKLSPDEGIPLL